MEKKIMLDVATLEQILLPESFDLYLKWAEGDRTRVVNFYIRNMKLSGIFYAKLQILEVTLRTRIHTKMTEVYHERWFESLKDPAEALAEEKTRLNKAKDEALATVLKCDKFAGAVDEVKKILTKDRKAEEKLQKQLLKEEDYEENPTKVIERLSFSFWANLFNKDAENLWRHTLNSIFYGEGLKRKDLSVPLHDILRLRNHIAHHKPILNFRVKRQILGRGDIYLKLPQIHGEIIKIAGWLNSKVAEFIREYSHFDEVWSADDNKK